MHSSLAMTFGKTIGTIVVANGGSSTKLFGVCDNPKGGVLTRPNVTKITFFARVWA